MRDSLEDKYILVHFKKAFLVPSARPGTDYSDTHLKEELADLFWKQQGMVFPIPPHRQSRQDGEHFANVCKRV